MSVRRASNRMRWCLPSVLDRYPFYSATEMVEDLQDLGIKISNAQLSRLIHLEPPRISSELLFGLTSILGCSAADLWVPPDDPAVADAEAARRRIDGRCPPLKGSHTLEEIKAILAEAEARQVDAYRKELADRILKRMDPARIPTTPLVPPHAQ